MNDSAAAGIHRSRRDLLLLLGGLCVSTVRSSAQRTPEATEIELRIGFARGAGGYSIETIPLEIYIARVLAGEAARQSPPAALEALAVTIRTFALGNPGRHRSDGFDLCDDTHCQVVRTATPATTRAAQATAAQVLMGSRTVASVFYSASCGGQTEIPSNVWPGADDPPYLPSRADDACRRAPAWAADLTAADLLRAFHAAGFRGARLRDISIASRNSSNRVARLALEGLTPSEISGQDLRMVVGRTLGWLHIKSAAFELRRRGSVYQFSGRGYGHGVGLCVTGATNLAAAGITAPAILQKYFPGAAIQTAASRMPGVALATPAPSPVIVSLPDDDAGERVAIERLALQARDDLARLLDVAAPATVTLRFHPTTEAYERATGQSWFTSGAWTGGELHLLPLAVLRERGVLERTVRHELVHALADNALGNRPAWVREGAAIYFAGERPIPGDTTREKSIPQEPRVRCPADHELLRPVSVGALADGYARARSCFVRQINAGRSWRDVR